MNFDELYTQLVEDFKLKGLSEEDKEEMLIEVSKTIQKQFILDVYDLLGKEKFAALQASISMGVDFYATTLKHLLPNYEEIFQAARQKVVKSFNEN